MKNLLTPCLFAGIAIGCSGDALGPPPEDVSLSASAAAACHAVQFESATLVVAPGEFAGNVTGDLEGTV